MLSSDSISPPFEGFSLQPPEHADGAKFQAQLFESEHADGTKLQAQLASPLESEKALVTTVAVSDVNTEKEGNQGLSSAPLSEVVDPKAIVFESSDNASMASMATLESNQENSPAIPSD
ncbi:hypothetical protein AAC387_Pa07g1653 [Persea americana]